MSRTVNDVSSGSCVAFGHVSMLTADLDRFRRFYEDVLGLRTVAIDHAVGQSFRRVAELADGSGAAARLLVFEVPGYSSGLADDVVARRGRLDQLTFHTADLDEFDHVARRLVEHGASSGEVSVAGSVRSVLFVDPDGGHHRLQSPRTGAAPSRTIEIVDEALWRQLHPANPSPTHQPQRPEV